MENKEGTNNQLLSDKADDNAPVRLSSTTVFISYSRKDKPFADYLNDALTKENFVTWIDWQNIPPTKKWLPEILAGIEGADAFVSIRSPASRVSKMCRVEFEHADKQHKRIILIQSRDVDINAFPQEMAAYQAISFPINTDEFGIEKAFQELLGAIKKDLDWVRTHTKIPEQAIEWQSKPNDTSLLLRGSRLKEAEGWRNQASNKKPTPTNLHRSYIRASRRAAVGRQITAFILAVISLVAITELEEIDRVTYERR